MSQIIIKYQAVIKYCILFASLFVFENLVAQSNKGLIRKAKSAFKDENYFMAAKLYAAVLYDSAIPKSNSSLILPFQQNGNAIRKPLKENSKTEILFQLAESYRLYQRYVDAAPQYANYIATKDDKHPLAQLWYGQALLSTEQPEKAILAFKEFLKKYKQKDDYASLASKWLANAEFANTMKATKPLASIHKLSITASQQGSNFGLEKISGNQIIFSSSRPEEKKNETYYPIRLYQADELNGIARKIKGLGADEFYSGASSTTLDGKRMYFTGWASNTNDARSKYRIYYSNRASALAEWETPILLNEAINLPGYQTRHPFVTRDGKYLFFSSDRPGGLGSYDLWKINLENGLPTGSAEHLGNLVNSKEEEASPFYEEQAEILYYSSKGLLGMGGFDLYQAKGNVLTNQWEFPAENMGYPFNSVKDDLYYFKDVQTQKMYISSDRSSACCLEIFEAKPIRYIDSSKIRDSLMAISKLLNEKRIADSIAMETAKQKALEDSVRQSLVSRFQIFYKFASSKIRKQDHALLDSIVDLLNQDMKLNLVIASFADCKGSVLANERISAKRSQSINQYLVAKGIDPMRIYMDYFGARYFMVPCEADESFSKNAQSMNRRSDLLLTKLNMPVWIPSGKEMGLPVDWKTHPQSLPGRQTLIQKMGNRQSKIKLAEKQIQPPSRTNGLDDINALTNQLLSQSSKEFAKRKLMQKASPSLQVNQLIAKAPKLQDDAVIEQLTRRTPKRIFEVVSASDSVRIDLYDNGVFDNDSVSVIYNKNLVVYRQMLLTHKPVSFYVKLGPDPKKNELIFVAENLGITPPNSALMVITDGDKKRTELNVTSDLDNNSVIYFIKVKK